MWRAVLRRQEEEQVCLRRPKVRSPQSKLSQWVLLILLI